MFRNKAALKNTSINIGYWHIERPFMAVDRNIDDNYC